MSIPAASQMVSATLSSTDATIIVIIGWNGSTVGRLIGVEGFADLESRVGQRVEVFARQLDDGRFTLYGDAAYFIKAH
jgi:hypothetical protein